MRNEDRHISKEIGDKGETFKGTRLNAGGLRERLPG